MISHAQTAARDLDASAGLGKDAIYAFGLELLDIHARGRSHPELGSGESFGTCYNYHTIPNNFNYMAGYSALLPEKAREMGLEVLDIPEAEY
ncbi:MAG TPA: hypothetical protein PLH51_24700, partial [Polyangiaceae bacterium]|nr:hypothetical protein [Polyangiaceae bacterium]